MSERFWDTPFPHPLKPKECRPLRTLRDADEFVRDRCATLGNPTVASALTTLRKAAHSGRDVDARRAFERASRLMHDYRWG